MQPGVREADQRLTARGAATRARIVAAASGLIRERGVAMTGLADVCAASGTSKSQLYQHFADKDALVLEVVGHQGRNLLEHQTERLDRLASIAELEQWRDEIVGVSSVRNGAGGCPLGSLAGELADHDEAARLLLAAHFADWERLLAGGLQRMRDSGELRSGADPAELASGLMAALQGGYLLAQTRRDSTPMRVALDMAIDHVRTFLSDPPSRPSADRTRACRPER